MSRDQQRDHDATTSAEPETARTKDDIHGLPPNLYSQAMRIGPGDVQGLRDLLTLFPDFARQILTVVSPNAGLSTVKQAQAMVRHNAVGKGGSLTSEQIHDGGEFAIESSAPVTAPAESSADAHATPSSEAAPAAARGKPPARTEQSIIAAANSIEGSVEQVPLRDDVREELMAIKPGDAHGLMRLLQQFPHMDSEILVLARSHLGAQTVEEAVALKLADGTSEGEHKAHGKVKKPGLQSDQQWVAARRYNRMYPAIAQQFNEYTDRVCVDSDAGAEGALDPAKVADWQSKHGLAADGKVGPRTLTTAHEAMEGTLVASSTVEGPPVL